MNPSSKMEKFWQQFTRKDWYQHKIGQFLFDVLFIQGTELYVTSVHHLTNTN